MSVNLAKHCFTVSEYERMGETGVFAPDARLEPVMPPALSESLSISMKSREVDSLLELRTQCA